MVLKCFFKNNRLLFVLNCNLNIRVLRLFWRIAVAGAARCLISIPVMLVAEGYETRRFFF